MSRERQVRRGMSTEGLKSVSGSLDRAETASELKNDVSLRRFIQS